MLKHKYSYLPTAMNTIKEKTMRELKYKYGAEGSCSIPHGLFSDGEVNGGNAAALVLSQSFH